ncbi:MAG: hypothetical protein OEW67_09825 [Cyclobacteriaceae bacterium]|nr:hypothetical protein [Cyclobacteriaceae bacterium]
MNIETRKTLLINWLSKLNNEALLNRIEELKQEYQAEIPLEIFSLLDTSNAVDSSKLIEHTNVRDLLS